MTPRREYAKGTTVSVSKSMAEVKDLLKAYGAQQIFTAEEEGRSSIACTFSLPDGTVRRLRWDVRAPSEEEFGTTVGGRSRGKPAKVSAAEAEHRRLWRVQVLHVKSTFEAILNGLVSFDRALLPYVVMPDGRTVGDHIEQEVAEVAATGRLPDFGLDKLLPP